jgi:hypothetical protein
LALLQGRVTTCAQVSSFSLTWTTLILEEEASAFDFAEAFLDRTTTYDTMMKFRVIIIDEIQNCISY